MVQRILKSKTIIFSLLLAICGAVEGSTGFLQSVLAPEQFGWVMLCIATITAILRVLTTQSLRDK